MADSTSKPVENSEKEPVAKAEEAVEPTPQKAEPAPATTAAPTGVSTAGSGGLNGAFPQELGGWNWGAFFLSWIWAIGNSTWIGLLALISPISLIVAIILGVKGNEWAWQNRKFESVEQFKAVQKAWATWGVILFILSLVIIIGMVVLGGFAAMSTSTVTTY